ncbi:cofactor assembly of complex C subunit B [Prochlorococcus marinus]|uniref:Cofactor assembly of complex C subunit B n=1 Tax=Prochlorococcus marinus XMU1408 TaxID=2213228 RepID=A0A318RB99_PROMR|nr:cofactor assembly of complex C subunit B [Prochlorococcus marinus]MBW3041973.1 cofactor assembly of complex C subunit B [Prochlorococcus marinus str. XMU1408]PYE03099.1 cofactor assembly of complex C subunit B [Prochlorococcus marinus XMU1408]
MYKISNLVILFGVFLLVLSIINIITATELNPSLVRGETISGIASIALITIGYLWTEIKPNPPTKAILKGIEGFDISEDLSEGQKYELAWGSHQILTATAASTILIVWDNEVVLRRGLITNNLFRPGEICNRAIEQNRMISLVNTDLFPGSEEFDCVLKDLPSVIVYPLSNRGLTIVGGWSKRAFTNSDEKWISGWSDKLSDLLNT